jgi:hypothetical protein
MDQASIGTVEQASLRSTALLIDCSTYRLFNRLHPFLRKRRNEWNLQGFQTPETQLARGAPVAELPSATCYGAGL